MKSVFRFISLCLLTFATASAQTTVSGTLLGHNGKPMLKANVVLKAMLQNKPVKIDEVDEKGRYNFGIDSAGIWMLVFAGVNHSSHEVVLCLDKPEKIGLNVQLKTYDYVDSIRGVKIEGPFNGYNAQAAVPLQKQPDGTFTGEFETKADTFGYEIVGATKDGHTINGTQSERYECDWAGDYTSIITPVNGKAKIVFDPAKLVMSDEPWKVSFADPLSFEARFSGVYGEMIQEQDDAMKAASEYRRSGKDMKKFTYDWSSVRTSIIDLLGKENNSVLRQELYLNYLWTCMLYSGKVDSTIIQEAFKEISPSSVVWSLSPTTILPALQSFSGLPAQKQEDYIENVLNENPNAIVKAQLLYILCIRAKMTHDSVKLATYYDMLVNKYGNTDEGKAAKASLSPKSNVAIGNPVPSFSIASLEDSMKLYTDDSFKGKYLLIDFWATWCGPCVGEMESLHRAHEKFKDKNFAILSVSLDNSPQDVEKFRDAKWKMPWLHAFAGQSDSKMAKDFEIIGIPHPVLIDPKGIIVAMDEDLRGENLEKTLEKYLGK